MIAGRGGVETAVDAVRPGGTVLVFADTAAIPGARVYRDELTIVGVRSAAPHLMEEAVGMLSRLELPEPTVLPLERFQDGLDLFRRRDALKVVFRP